MIDLRSDTVTKPTPPMMEAIANAELGDDVYGEDPTVTELEAYAAQLTGMEAGLYAASGTQTNLLGLLAHCERGHEYIVGHTAHTYMYEAGGGAVLGSIQPCPLPFNERGELDLNQVEAAIKPDDSHFAMTRLVSLENTQGGKVLPLEYLERYDELTRRHGLKRHLDGARVFNASVALNVPVTEIARHFDTMSICLSKGLGAPIGSVLVGDVATIKRARRWRKMVGGGMRQAGIIAAAGLYALQNNIERLAEDHARTARLADALASIQGFTLAESPQTNMLFLDDSMDIAGLKAYLAEAGIIISGARWVLHMDVSDEDVDSVIAACKAFPSA
jgi:threonine aldolase